MMQRRQRRKMLSSTAFHPHGLNHANGVQFQYWISQSFIQCAFSRPALEQSASIARGAGTVQTKTRYSDTVNKPQSLSGKSERGSSQLSATSPRAKWCRRTEAFDVSTE